jgi:hypothetical protein
MQTPTKLRHETQNIIKEIILYFPPIDNLPRSQIREVLKTDRSLNVIPLLCMWSPVGAQIGPKPAWSSIKCHLGARKCRLEKKMTKNKWIFQYLNIWIMMSQNTKNWIKLHWNFYSQGLKDLLTVSTSHMTIESKNSNAVRFTRPLETQHVWKYVNLPFFIILFWDAAIFKDSNKIRSKIWTTANRSWNNAQ